MTDKEIRARLTQFADRIFEMENSEAYVVSKELNDFCKEHKVTLDQMEVFAETGAGEMLHMMLV